MWRVLQAGLASLAFAAATASCAQTGQAQSEQAGQEVVTHVGEWRDDARGRGVPYRMYLPSRAEPSPVVIFSHGLGGSRDAARFLLEHLAANGFVAVAIQHPGSDRALLTGEGRPLERLRESTRDPAPAIARFGDVRFAIDQLERENASGPLTGRFDLTRIGMSGHSYGALTTLMSVGQRPALGPADAFADSRIGAAIVYSPNAPRNQDADVALANVRTPILHFTGTNDQTPLDPHLTPEARLIPFRAINGADQFLLVFAGGEHGIYSGRQQQTGDMTAVERAQSEAILRESLTFWRAYLLGDRDALAALCALPARIAAIGAAEVKAERCG